MEKRKNNEAMGEDSMILVSVIVPVFNTEKYLPKCVESILSQTFKNFELILINDGSTDSSLSIVQKYKALDNRIVVIDKPNSGVSDTRNLGIKKATGKYICFIDSDDWVENDYLESLLEAEPMDGQLIIQNHDRNRKLTPGIYYLPEDTERFFLDNNILYFGGPVAKLFSRKVITENSLSFHVEVTYGEDLMFFLSYLKHTESVNLQDTAKYHYSYNPESLSTRKHSFESFYRYLIFLDHYVMSLQRSPQLKKYIFTVNWDFIESALNQGIHFNTKSMEEKYKKISKLGSILNHSHLRYAGLYRKLLYLLIKTKNYRILTVILSFTNKSK